MVDLNELVSQTSSYSAELKYRLSEKERNIQRRDQYKKEVGKLATDILNMREAIRLLNTVSDKNMDSMLETITSAVNSVLAVMFSNSGDTYEILLVKSLYNDRIGHMKVELLQNGNARDLALQSGDGIKQVIGFLFNTLLVSVSGGRRLIIMDEVLNGLSPEAAEGAVASLIKMFSEQGFQFIMVDQGRYNPGSAIDPITKYVEVRKIDTNSVVFDQSADVEEYNG